MFTQKDLKQISDRGISIDEINRQIRYFQTGFPPADITLPATPGQGIMLLAEGEEQHYHDVFLNNGPDFQITRFIPASGAATRMFKTLYEAREKLEKKKSDQQWKWVDKKKEMKRFFKNWARVRDDFRAGLFPIQLIRSKYSYFNKSKVPSVRIWSTKMLIQLRKSGSPLRMAKA